MKVDIAGIIRENMNNVEIRAIRMHKKEMTYEEEKKEYFNKKLEN